VPVWSLFFQISINALYAISARHLTTRACHSHGCGRAGLTITRMTQWDIGGRVDVAPSRIVRILFSFSAGVLLSAYLNACCETLAQGPPGYIALILAARCARRWPSRFRSSGSTTSLRFFLFPMIVGWRETQIRRGRLAYSLAAFLSALRSSLSAVHVEDYRQSL